MEIIKVVDSWLGIQTVGRSLFECLPTSGGRYGKNDILIFVVILTMPICDDIFKVNSFKPYKQLKRTVMSLKATYIHVWLAFHSSYNSDLWQNYKMDYGAISNERRHFTINRNNVVCVQSDSAPWSCIIFIDVGKKNHNWILNKSE